MAGLAEVRRWVNYSKLIQRVWNSRQGAFETVHPRGYVEGAQYAAECGNPALRETTAHLTQQEFSDRLPFEKDVDLLKRLAMIEANEIAPRPAVVKLIEERVIKIMRGENAAADVGGSGKQGPQANGPGAAGAAAA